MIIFKIGNIGWEAVVFCFRDACLVGFFGFAGGKENCWGPLGCSIMSYGVFHREKNESTSAVPERNNFPSCAFVHCDVNWSKLWFYQGWYLFLCFDMSISALVKTSLFFSMKNFFFILIKTRKNGNGNRMFQMPLPMHPSIQQSNTLLS